MTTAKEFRQTLNEWNAAMLYHETLHVFLFRAPTERIRDALREQIITHPQLELDLLAELNLAGIGIYDDPILRRICYNLAKSWELPEKFRDYTDLCVIDFWTQIISWLGRYGGEIPDLPGAVRYYFNEDAPRLDGFAKYPPSFPRIS